MGCFKWKGAASTESAYDDGSLRGVQTGSAVVEFEVLHTLPGSMQFEPRRGFADGIGSGSAGACQMRSIGEQRVIPTSALPDGLLYLNLDLDLGFGDPPNRNLITFTGSSQLLTTTTMSCPSVPDITSVREGSWTWLQVDSEATYTVSADGQTIEGSYIASFPLTHSSIKTLFRFSAVREWRPKLGLACAPDLWPELAHQFTAFRPQPVRNRSTLLTALSIGRRRRAAATICRCGCPSPRCKVRATT